MNLRPRLTISTIALTLFVAGIVWCGWGLRDARRSALASTAQSPLNQLNLALANYEDRYGTFPPAYTTDQNGRPMHSWRALILPYVGCPEIYEQYDYSEPWDGPNNSKLANQMPSCFLSATEPPSTSHTNVVALTGPGTVFPRADGTRLKDIADRPQNTILLVEITNSQIPWLAPIDLPAEEAIAAWNTTQQPGISAVSWRRPLVCFCDRQAAYSLSRTLTKDNLRALTTIAGGEPVSQDRLIQDRQIRRGVWIE